MQRKYEAGQARVALSIRKPQQNKDGETAKKEKGKQKRTKRDERWTACGKFVHTSSAALSIPVPVQAGTHAEGTKTDD